MNSKSEYFRNNQIALRECILYASTDGFPAYQTFKNLCAKIGDNVIDYVDFEFWYMRFARGELDMNYDRSLEPKTRSFLDLPVDVHKIIGKELTFADFLIVRNVSKFFKNLIDGLIPDFKQVSIKIYKATTTLKLDDTQLNYTNDLGRYLDGVNTNIIHWKLAISQMLIMFKNTKIQLEKLTVQFLADEVIEDKIAEKFQAMDLKISTPIVELVTKYSNGEMAILPFLEPGKLKEIIYHSIDVYPRTYKERLTRIGRLEQCQQLEKLTINFMYCEPEMFPIKEFINCTYLHLDFDEYAPEIRDVLRFKKFVIKSNRLNYFHLVARCEFEIDELKSQLGKAALEVPNRPNIRHFKIRNSDEYFELDLTLSLDDEKIDLTIKRMNGPI